MSERPTQKFLPGFADAESKSAPTANLEKEAATHIITKGKVVYFPHSDEAYTTRHPFYARYVSQSDRRGWAWYQSMGPISLWREEVKQFDQPVQILVGPKSAVKRQP